MLVAADLAPVEPSTQPVVKGCTADLILVNQGRLANCSLAGLPNNRR